MTKQEQIEALTARLQVIADALNARYDCPYFASSGWVGKKQAAVVVALKCPLGCEEDLREPKECWRRWVTESPEWWWGV